MRVEYNGEQLDVDYDVIGIHRNATYDSPVEYPEIVITAINYMGVDIMPILNGEQIDLIYEKVCEDYD
jgi:hypothetical protein